ncbi:Cys-Gln thioester bond-forming surface protein [Streptomyces gobiensis]|uniref:Cys-Gln thioester bond-forming surface protein n=1 Tax=Streptomyces gobiensis TaxID=2875706 RepID=UPI001E370FC7|nr:Cys-Gln thioester bond-forming surface protein [Streptomyces gobiensis]UGY91456.1 thioester domain-containing protein [Streptomyces gobiensis]
MISIRGRAATRRVAAALASGLLAAVGAVAGAGPAAAEEPLGSAPSSDGATAVLDGLKVYDQAIVREDGETTETGAGLFEMSVAGGGSLQTYCIDMHNPTQEQAQYQEVPWQTSSLHDNPDAGRIRWILQNSYPQVDDLAALAKKSGARQLTPQTAAAGTQVAIWRYSDGADVSAVDKNAEKLAGYLEKAAKNLTEPRASLSLDPPAVSGKPGERLGPVTVRTTAQRTSVVPAPDAASHGVRIVGRDGKEITTAADGDQLWFDVPADAEAAFTSLTVQGATTVPVGRAFTGIGEHAISQTQILAGSSDSTVTATATANWAAQGAVPAVSARKNCAAGGLDITVSNQGDEPFSFNLGEASYETPAGKTETVTVPVQEDQAYKITINGPHGFAQTFSGVLDCATVTSGSGDDKGTAVQTTPVTVGGSGSDVNLAETGNSSNVPLLVGVALGLLVLGGGAVLMVRRNKAEPADTDE